jgi:hypothetical protein
MLDMPLPSPAPARRHRTWTIVRLSLELAPMVGALVSWMLLLYTGMHAWSLATVVLTSLSTTVSVLLFSSTVFAA